MWHVERVAVAAAQTKIIIKNQIQTRRFHTKHKFTFIKWALFGASISSWASPLIPFVANNFSECRAGCNCIFSGNVPPPTLYNRGDSRLWARIESCSPFLVRFGWLKIPPPPLSTTPLVHHPSLRPVNEMMSPPIPLRPQKKKTTLMALIFYTGPEVVLARSSLSLMTQPHTASCPPPCWLWILFCFFHLFKLAKLKVLFAFA